MALRITGLWFAERQGPRGRERGSSLSPMGVERWCHGLEITWGASRRTDTCVPRSAVEL